MTNETKSTDKPFTHGISRRKLLSTLALGSTALGTAVVSMSGEGRLAKLITGGTPTTNRLNLGDTLIKPAQAQATDWGGEFSFGFGVGDDPSSSGGLTFSATIADDTVSSTSVSYAAANPAVDTEQTLYWSVIGGVGVGPLSIARKLPTGVVERRLPVYVTSGSSITDSDFAVTFTPESVNAFQTMHSIGSMDFAVTMYPVTYRDPGNGNTYVVGQYVTRDIAARVWHFVPGIGGIDENWDLEVPLNVDGVVQYFPLGRIDSRVISHLNSAISDGRQLLRRLGTSESALAVDNSAPVGGRRQDLDAALSAFNPIDGSTPTSLTNFWASYRATFITTPAPTSAPASGTLTAAPTSAPASGTTPTTAMPTSPPASGTTPTTTPTTTMMTGAGTPTSPTTPTTTPTTTMMAGAGTPTSPTTPTTTTGAGTPTSPTTLVSTTAAATTAAATTLVSTTVSDPAIAGALPIGGAINAQGNIGGDVARSLSGRLSSFRNRNRNKTGQRQQVPTRRR